MGIVKKDLANFNPNVKIPSKVDSFRFWCQKVLPLAYDDSLSYYELLCKIVDYLNNTIADVNTLGDDVDNLNKAFVELQGYVNNYFITLDVQKEINNKLDVMAQDGTLSALIKPLFDDYKTEIDKEVNNQTNKIVVLENRMDTFTKLPSGSTSGDAELKDIRVPANGFNSDEAYNTAGDAVRGQASSLKANLDVINENLYNNGNLIFKVVEGYYLIPSDVGEQISTRENADFSYCIANVNNLKKISVSAVGTPLFTFFTNEKNVIIQKGIDFISSNNDKTINVPKNATYYYFSNNTPKIKNSVVINGDTVPSPFDIIDKPVGLHINQVKKLDVSDSINAVTGYDNLTDSSKIKLNIDTFGTSSIMGNIITVNGVNGGFTTSSFSSNTSKLMILLDCEFTFSKLAITIRVNKNDGSFQFKTIKTSTTQGLQNPVYFDCAYEIVYNDAKSFEIIVNCNDGNINTGTLTVNQFTVRELNGWKLNKLYDESFGGLISNVFNAIEEKTSDTNTDLVLANENGEKFSLSVTGNALTLIPNIPNKVLFMGNSLLLGMDTKGVNGGAFGMCATDYTKDYAYIVENAILNKNSDATFNKLHVSEFEQSETLEEARNYIKSNKIQFTDDMDLIILQLGDNVNNEIRRNVFKTSFLELLKEIRTDCKKARIIVCGIWFTSETYETLSQCINYGCELVDIRSLNVKENQGVTGETITYKDGSTESLPAPWSTHAGNKGMALIANAIINKINM